MRPFDTTPAEREGKKKTYFLSQLKRIQRMPFLRRSTEEPFRTDQNSEEDSLQELQA